MLNTETNTPAMERKVLTAYRDSGFPLATGARAVFEHGQWWIETRDGAQWSVCDSNSATGFWFEQVSQGEEC